MTFAVWWDISRPSARARRNVVLVIIYYSHSIQCSNSGVRLKKYYTYVLFVSTLASKIFVHLVGMWALARPPGAAGHRRARLYRAGHFDAPAHTYHCIGRLQISTEYSFIIELNVQYEHYIDLILIMFVFECWLYCRNIFIQIE